jgi:transcription antitermination factor NusG
VRELCPEAGGAAFAIPAAGDICKTDGRNWYALAVRHQHERQVARLLEAQGWETLAPMYRSRRQWSDRVKELELPLFAGYVFCRFSLAERIRVEDAPGVVQIVKFNGRAAALAAEEIARIRAMVASKVALRPWPYLKAGDRVRVERGPLRGLEGTLLRDAGAARLVVGVELLQRAIAAEVDPDVVVPLRALAAHS